MVVAYKSRISQDNPSYNLIKYQNIYCHFNIDVDQQNCIFFYNKDLIRAASIQVYGTGICVASYSNDTSCTFEFVSTKRFNPYCNTIAMFICNTL